MNSPDTAELRQHLPIVSYPVSYAVEEFGRQLRARVQVTRQDLAEIRQRRQQPKAEIGNLARAIAALLSELTSREKELEAINDELLSAEGNGIDARLEEIESFLHQRLKDIRGLLLGDVAQAKAELAKHCQSIILTPEGDSYRLSGEWLLGSVRLSGAGGPVCTTREVEFSFDVAARKRSPAQRGNWQGRIATDARE